MFDDSDNRVVLEKLKVIVQVLARSTVNKLRNTNTGHTVGNAVAFWARMMWFRFYAISHKDHQQFKSE